MPETHCKDHQDLVTSIVVTSTKMDIMQNDIRDLKESSKQIGETVIRIESSIEGFKSISESHDKQISENTKEIQKIKISDAIQTDNIGLFKNWLSKWGPIVAILAYAVLEKTT